MMRSWAFLLSPCLCCLCFASPLQERILDPQALSQLTSALGLPGDADPLTEMQKHWLRKAGQERWEQAEISSEQRLLVLEWAKEQGLFAPWNPADTTYDKALILGATTPLMQKRLDFLKELWLQGVRFQEIVWLTGDRALDAHVDDLLDRCSNESQAAHIIWEEAHLPEAMRSLPVVFIAVPMKEGPCPKRPNTEDTLVAWLQTAPQPCKALFISDQPFCGYQFAVVKTCLPSSFQCDLAGPGANPSSHPAAAAITLDSIARWIYQESLYQAQKQ